MHLQTSPLFLTAFWKMDVIVHMCPDEYILARSGDTVWTLLHSQSTAKRGRAASFARLKNPRSFHSTEVKP